MTAQEISDKIWERYFFTWVNSRGSHTQYDKYIPYGIPTPKRNESDDDMKGGDRIGFVETVITAEMVGKKIAVFASFEIKTKNDRLKKGQINWHNFVIDHGGISQIWKELEVTSERID